MIDWKKDLKDAMWSMFWLGKPEDGLTPHGDMEVIKKNVAELIRMATQKTSGQRRAKNDISWDALDHTLLAIACSATSLALSGYFGEMPEEIQGDL